MDELTSKARSVFADDKYATELTGIAIDSVSLDHTCCSLKVERCHKNARGVVMGGVIFTLADITFAIAANSALLKCDSDEETTLEWVSSSSTIHYLSAANGNMLYSMSKCIKQGRSQAIYEIDIFDENKRHIAMVTTTGTRILSTNS
ncbi:MAG: PaaI family thioesterase [Bacteroidales bacterium]|nr:PaaI family thioesterase [Bacteroidales bacterium]